MNSNIYKYKNKYMFFLTLTNEMLVFSSNTVCSKYHFLLKVPGIITKVGYFEYGAGKIQYQLPSTLARKQAGPSKTNESTPERKICHNKELSFCND